MNEPPTIEEINEQAVRSYWRMLNIQGLAGDVAAQRAVAAYVKMQEQAHALDQATDQKTEERRDVGNDERVQGGEAAFRLEGRPAREVESSGDRDRPVGIGAEPFVIATYEIGPKERAQFEEAQRQAEAERRALLAPAPYKVRVFINDLDRTHVDLGPLAIRWDHWLTGFHYYHGVAHDKGFIPKEAIRMIVHLDEKGEPEKLGENVVPFRKTPA